MYQRLPTHCTIGEKEIKIKAKLILHVFQHNNYQRLKSFQEFPLTNILTADKVGDCGAVLCKDIVYRRFMCILHVAKSVHIALICHVTR